ncbi:MAG: hypothetical protein HOJ34_00325, partial [Kordiimonadaceae bacterium]|nr:hypothetical protein [Kordiimonadaceae bacterium]
MTINKNISVAVLPFEVFNQNQRLKTLIHGLTEDLITNLSKFVGLSVVSQFSTQQIKDLTNFDEIEKLGANFLVFGSIRNIADKLRITIQLIKANDRSVIYSGQHNITVAEIFDTQDQLIQKIVSTLQKEIDYNLLSYSYKKEPTSLAAYEDWLMGMDCLKKGTFDSDKQAREYFEAAL